MKSITKSFRLISSKLSSARPGTGELNRLGIEKYNRYSKFFMFALRESASDFETPGVSWVTQLDKIKIPTNGVNKLL